MSSAKLKRRWLPNTIGARLTLWGAAVTFVICAAICATLYAGVFFTLRDEVDTFLIGEVRELSTTASEYPGDDRSLERDIREELGARALGDLAFRLFDLEGKMILSSEREDPLVGQWRPTTLLAADADAATFETVRPTGVEFGYRLCSMRATLHDGREGIAQSSYSLQRMTESLARFRRICVGALVLSLLLSLAVGRFLATRSLKPIRVITEKAQQIGTGQLDKRLPLSGVGDELDQLIGTLNDLLARIEHHVLQIRRFTADASHELRTPLAALRGATEVVLSKDRSAEVLRRCLEENMSHFARLQRIAEDLLLLSRLDAGEQILRREPVRLDEAVRSMLDLYRPVADERAIGLRCDDWPPIEVLGDPGRIRQVISNLLDNALKYTPENGHIQVSLASVGGFARVSIEDDGIGIPKQDLPRVFDRFFRGDSSRKSTSGSGSGLGLSISRSIVLALGGELEISSEASAGTVARVSFPLEHIQ